MNLSDFNIKNLGKDLLENKVLSNFVNKFINELKEYLEKCDNRNFMNVSYQNKYNNYWGHQPFIEYNVAATIGLSRWGADFTYNNELNKAVDDSILEIAQKEGTLYRKQFMANGSGSSGFYNVDKFENGQIEYLKIPINIIPNEFENKDIIFQYKSNGTIKIREDLREEIVNLTSEKVNSIKEKEIKINNEYKKEGHIYEAFEDEGYIFLNDLTEKTEILIEDIDFVVDSYKGDGKYQVINGEYEKID